MERDFAQMNEEYGKWFRGVPEAALGALVVAEGKEGEGEGGKVGVRPARSCVEVRRLPLGVEVEIECWALP